MTVKRVKLRVGTRGSPLALAQVEIVRAALARVRPDVEIEIVIIKTSGDWTPAQGERPLDPTQGGKALFAKELEEALLEDKIDAAVHSLKDMESVLPRGLIIGAVLPREDVRDAVILKKENAAIKRLEDLPHGFVIGTCSVRRAGMLLAARPDLKIETLRGNVGTRLQKLEAGTMDGIVLAMAGLNRLQLAKKMSFLLPESQIVPCAGQGCIAIEFKEKNQICLSVFGQINCPETFIRVKCEREVLAKLGGSCHTPIGVHAIIKSGKLSVDARLVSPEGSKTYRSVSEEFLPIDTSDVTEKVQKTNQSVFYDSENYKNCIMLAEKVGRAVGSELKIKVPREFL